jgi:RimJ/RimL family protein N-acetyltransferase
MADLSEVTDAQFAWLLGEGAAPDGSPTIPEGGLAPPEVIALLRQVAIGAREPEHAKAVAWFVLVDGEAAGLISYKGRPADGRAEMGYGIAPSRQGRGIASAGVEAMIRHANASGLAGLVAETGVDNRASQRVLEPNGFRRTGQRNDPEDGPLLVWEISV